MKKTAFLTPKLSSTWMLFTNSGHGLVLKSFSAFGRCVRLKTRIETKATPGDRLRTPTKLRVPEAGVSCSGVVVAALAYGAARGPLTGGRLRLSDRLRPRAIHKRQ